MKIFLKVLIIFIIAFSQNARASADNSEIIGKVVQIIKKENSNDRNDVYVKILTINDNSEFIIDDFFIVFIIEDTYKVLLSDYILKDVTLLNISVKLKNVSFGKSNLNGVEMNFINSVQKIYPNFPQSENSYLYKDLNPGIPDEDYYHRFIDVPISYNQPNKGTFKLYYELCSDFDKNKPTVLIPTDGQRSLSQVGWADKYKKLFNLNYNTVTYEYRGMYCSKIDAISGEITNWIEAYKILNSDNVVEDIERIRQDLLRDEKINILGGSGTAMIGLKYVAKYPEKVNRAFLMSFFKDAKGSSESGVLFFNNFLKENNLNETYNKAITNEKIELKQLLFLIQRLLYSDKEEVKQLIVELSENKINRYKKS